MLLIQPVLPGVCTSRLTGGVSRRRQTLPALTYQVKRRGRESEGRRKGEEVGKSYLDPRWKRDKEDERGRARRKKNGKNKTREE